MIKTVYSTEPKIFFIWPCTEKRLSTFGLKKHNSISIVHVIPTNSIIVPAVFSQILAKKQTTRASKYLDEISISAPEMGTDLLFFLLGRVSQH